MSCSSSSSNCKDGGHVDLQQFCQLPSVYDASNTSRNDQINTQATTFTVRSRTRSIDLLNHMVDSNVAGRQSMLFVRDLAVSAHPITASGQLPPSAADEMILPAVTPNLHSYSAKLGCLEPVYVASFQ